jgi:hypothetical protein
MFIIVQHCGKDVPDGGQITKLISEGENRGEEFHFLVSQPNLLLIRYKGAHSGSSRAEAPRLTKIGTIL